MTCEICGLPAHVIDLDHDSAYCDLHADERLVCAGNHEHISQQSREEEP